MDDPAPPPRVALRGITKRFGGTVAVDDVSVDLRAGAVHALVGENGAGKSTLVKILAGVHEPTEGEVILDGTPVRLRSPKAAIDHGVAFVAQELALVPARSVVENVLIGREIAWGPFVRSRAARRHVVRLMERVNISVEPDVLVGELSVAEQQKVELLRALDRDSRIIIMDEPTARLSTTEADALRSIVLALAASGKAIAYVSHFLDEVMALADEITIMRDGRLVRTTTPAAETVDSIIEAMIGRRLENNFPPVVRIPAPTEPPLLDVSGLSRHGTFADVSFQVHRGEIVGFAGLVGAGRSELMHTIFGATRPDGGTVTFAGKPGCARHPGAALARGMAMIPESRKDQGLIPTRSIKENITLPHLAPLAWLGLIRHGAEERFATAASSAVDVRASSITMPVSALSGGNQQKVLFARALAGEPTLVIADEPTRGVDVGAKRSIYELVVALAAAGSGVVLVSSELEEVLGLSHRICVMRNGRLTAEFDREDATSDDIMAAAFGTSVAATPQENRSPDE